MDALDIMCKAADVDLIGYENVASGYISVLVRGDVGACKTAVEAGVKAVKKLLEEKEVKYFHDLANAAVDAMEQDVLNAMSMFALE